MSNKGKRRVEYYEFEIGRLPRKVSRYERRSQRRKDTYSLLPLGIVIGGIVIGNISNVFGSVINQVFAQEPELLSPYVKPYEVIYEDDLVREVRINEADVSSNFSVPLQQDYSQIVKEVFGDDSEDALKIMQCESRGNPETIGDKHLMSINQQTGELVGDSIGLFQIRTGSTGWNRAKANGMTADEFRTYLKNPENNIRYAKTIFDQKGWSAWFNCMNKVLVK